MCPSIVGAKRFYDPWVGSVFPGQETLEKLAKIKSSVVDFGG